MVESNFEYTEGLIKKVNTNASRKCNLITEIAMFIILLGMVALFIGGNTALGLISGGVFIVLLVGLIFSNLSIEKSNRVLVGQNVNIVFYDKKMTMTAKLGQRTLYRANFDYNAITNIKYYQDLMVVYFNKVSAVVIPKTSFKTIQDCERAVELMSNNYVI